LEERLRRWSRRRLGAPQALDFRKVASLDRLFPENKKFKNQEKNTEAGAKFKEKAFGFEIRLMLTRSQKAEGSKRQRRSNGFSRPTL